MAVEHRAFLFDWDTFNADLRVILEPALFSGDVEELVAFVRLHLVDLRDPYKGDPIDGTWQSQLRFHDAQEIGDWALTNYYDPRRDVGLGIESDRLVGLYDAFGINPSFHMVPILGAILGPDDNPFDPGRLGSYFQTPEHVVGNHLYLTSRAHDLDVPELELGLRMLKQAMDANRGLYVTF
jgi:hypothetical protein